MATRGERLPGTGQTQLSNETHVARPGGRIHTAYSGTQLYPEGHRRARILPVPEAIFWYDLTSAQEARPQPTSDEAKGQRHETKAAAGAQAQREESDATLPRGAAPRAHPSSARSTFWYDLTSAQEAGPQPTSDEAKGRRHETEAAAGAQAQREESDATLPRGAAPRAHPSSA